MLQASVDTSFTLGIQYKVDYGSGPLILNKNFGTAALCDEVVGYFPQYGIFNVTSSLADNNTGQNYNLYTQIVNRPFDAKVFAYDSSDVNTPVETNASIEVEVFNAQLFTRDGTLACLNPDSNISSPTFINFNQRKFVTLNNLSFNIALQEAGFRTWHLERDDGTFVYHSCLDRNDEICFRSVYQNNYPADINCSTPCSVGGEGCYECLRKTYGKVLCSRDNFSIRPEAFTVQLKDSNQSNDVSLGNIELANSTNSNGLNNQSKLVSEYNYRFDVVATNYLNDSPSPKYVQDFNINSDVRAFMKWRPKTPISSCKDSSDQNITVNIKDGQSPYQGTSSNSLIASLDSIDNVGEYELNITDREWTAIDWKASEITHHTRTGFQNDSDCIEGSGIVINPLNLGKNGCEVSNVHTHPNGSIYRALELRYYPYTFDMTQMQEGAGPAQIRNGNPDFIYINTLSTVLYPNGIDENMSYNIFGNFRAVGYNGGILNNFSNGCFAENTSLTLNYSYQSNLPINTPNLTYDLIEGNSSVTTSPRVQVDLANNNTPLVITHSPANFVPQRDGQIELDLGLNFNRRNNRELNPRLLNFADFNVSYVTQPNLNVDLKNNHLIFGDFALDHNISFIYGQAKASKEFYNDITQTNIQTPINILLYCDLGFIECQRRGIDTVNGQMNEGLWWLSTNHQSPQDGLVTLSTAPITEGIAPNATVSAQANNINNGQDINIVVNQGTGATLPTTIPVIFGANTDRWLIYNAFSATLLPNPLYTVRFIDAPLGWAGVGETGNVLGTNSNNKTNKRLDW